MTIKNTAILCVLFFSDLSEDLKATIEGENHDTPITIHDFKDDVQDAAENADVVIYQDEAGNRKIIVFNNDLNTETAPAYELLEQDEETNEDWVDTNL